MLEAACGGYNSGCSSRVGFLAKGFTPMLSVHFGELSSLLCTLVPCPGEHEALLERLGA